MWRQDKRLMGNRADWAPGWLRAIAALATAGALISCQTKDKAADTAAKGRYDGIAPGETVRFTGSEPFWGGEVTGGTLVYTTPDNPDGTAITVRRFAGNNGLGYSGTLAGKSFDMTITPGECSDSMSDRRYPFTVTLRMGNEQREGCGWIGGNSPAEKPAD